MSAELEWECTCGAALDSYLHSITCAVSAATSPNAMITSDGTVFYPDNPIEAWEYATVDDAAPVAVDAFNAWIRDCFAAFVVDDVMRRFKQQ